MTSENTPTWEQYRDGIIRKKSVKLKLTATIIPDVATNTFDAYVKNIKEGLERNKLSILDLDTAKNWCDNQWVEMSQ